MTCKYSLKELLNFNELDFSAAIWESVGHENCSWLVDYFQDRDIEHNCNIIRELEYHIPNEYRLLYAAHIVSISNIIEGGKNQSEIEGYDNALSESIKSIQCNGLPVSALFVNNYIRSLAIILTYGNFEITIKGVIADDYIFFSDNE